MRSAATGRKVSSASPASERRQTRLAAGRSHTGGREKVYGVAKGVSGTEGHLTRGSGHKAGSACVFVVVAIFFKHSGSVYL